MKRVAGACLAFGYVVALASCSSEPEVVYVYVPVPMDAMPSSDDATDASPDDVLSGDGGPSSDAGPALDSVDGSSAIDGSASEDVPWADGPTGAEGLTDGEGLIVYPSALEGLWYFGLGVEPGTPLGSIGDTAIGIILLPSIVELADGVMTIRVFDTEAFVVVDGEDGVIEQYAYAPWGNDGAIRIDLSEPLTSVEVNFWQGCVYAMDTYLPYGDPVFADGLMTWTALEIYESQNCGNQGFPMSAGVNVHFLRREEANLDFTPRAVEPEAPFGFFEATWGGTDYMTRMPQVGDGAPDGGITYYVSDDFPDDIRHVVDEVFDAWNDALEEAAGNRPFVVEDAPGGMVPWDPRYRVVYWDDSKSDGAI
ncbi:MAG: hypothetical protein QF464_20745, partial [Myxococcota bacterium]|nr:hypothetical protein [Myxococcota bacterium]